ncbi:MAG: class I adenylate-forming enzyme family protein [Gammaproteobacteria bacterium]
MLANLLDQVCEKHADKVALIYKEKTYTYAQLHYLVNKLAAALLNLKLLPGDKVAFFLSNRPEIILCLLACFKLGITAIPIRQFSKSQQLLSLIKAAQPKLLITENSLLQEVLALPSTILRQLDCYNTDSVAASNVGIKCFSTLLDSGDLQSKFPSISEDAIATIAFTSGSTGEPKGIVHTQKQLYSFLVAHALQVKYTSEDRVLIYVPVSFAYGFSNQVLPSLYSAATILLIQTGQWEEIIAAIKYQQATLLYVAASPIPLINLLEKQPALNHHLRAIFSAGDTMPIPILKRMQKIFNTRVYEGIGMTETWLYALNTLGESKLGSVGKPCAGMQIKIIGDNGQVLPPGCTGEIAVKGDSMMVGYFSNQHKALLREGWFYTGDCGYLDAEGYLFFRGRKEYLISKNGTIIYPHEIEFTLYEHPNVLEAGVTGLQADRDNAKILAYIALVSEEVATSKAELMQHLQAHLTSFQMPDDIKILPQLPKALKIDRKQLRQLAMNN